MGGELPDTVKQTDYNYLKQFLQIFCIFIIKKLVPLFHVPVPLPYFL